MSKQYKYTKTFTFDGQRYFVYANTQKEAMEKLARKRQDLENGRVILHPTMTVSEWATEWLKTYKEPSISKTTLADYRARLNNHILPTIGHMRLKDVKSSHLQTVLNNMAGFSRDRLNKTRNAIKQMFEAAKLNRLVLDTPAIGLQLPKSSDGTHRSITPYERSIALRVAEYHHASNWILTMLYCGLRPQETAALQGRHINLKKGILHIEQALKKNGEIGETKTGAGKRDVPFPDKLRPFLTQAARDKFGFVFKSEQGKPLSNNNWGSMWESFKRYMQIEAGCKVAQTIFINGEKKIIVKDIVANDIKTNAPYTLMPPYPIAADLVPYCFRHTFCTDLQDAGVSINVAKDLMGHTSISTTARIYTHMTDAQLRQTAERLEAFRAVQN